MSDEPVPLTPDDSALNRRLGWLLVGLGFLWAAWLDPWALGTAGTEMTLRLALRQAQGVLLGMGLLQLLVARLTPQHQEAPAIVSWLTAVGALCYATGYLLRLQFPAGGYLVPVGALLNLSGIWLLWQSYARAGAEVAVRVGLGAILLGMLLDLGTGLISLLPNVLTAYLGPEQGVRMRMLRLARVAAIALPAQLILFQQLRRYAPDGRAARWGNWALAFGAAGMPSVLTAAALTDLRLKYLLPLPADALLFGVGAAVWLAFRPGTRMERWGWGLLLASMALGQVLGGFAFDGPLPAPAAFTGYLDFVRSLVRIGHAYAIVLALLALFAEESGRTPDRSRGLTLLVAGSVITLMAMGLVAARLAPAAWLTPGPVLVALATAVIGTEKVPK